MKTIQACLKTLNVSKEALSACGNIEEEFVCIKKLYREQVLVAHPDKGGDPALFRQVRASFEVLRDLYSHQKVDSFAAAASQAAESYDQTWQDFEGVPTPSWDFFYSAAEKDVPLYKVELAKSGRSGCKQTGKAKKCTADPPLIAKGEIRIGSMDQESGAYARWNHLQCWRVPSKVWLGVPDPETCDDMEAFAAALRSMNDVLLCGFEALPESDQQTFIEHVMDKDNWARLTKRKAPPTAVAASAMSAEEASASTGLVAQAPREVFLVPRPGKNGCAADVFAGKTFVLTGTFPEVGGGVGFNVGKEKVKAMIQAFGGRVTSAVSGKTDILVVGKDPGMGSVKKARLRENLQLVNLKDLKEKGIEMGKIEDSGPVIITNFSNGYGGTKGLVLAASKEEIAFAAGIAPSRVTHDSAKKRAAVQDDSKPPAKKSKTKPKAAAKAAPKAARKDFKPPVKKAVAKKAAAPEASALKDSKSKKAATKKPKAPSKKATKKSKKAKESFSITCDGCGVDCTAKSWFIEQDESDFCGECKEAGGKENAVMQVDGEPVAAA